MIQALSSLRIAETPIAVFDLETTGRSTNYGAEIVEASVVRIEPGKAPFVAFDSLIKPQGKMRCTEIHKIKSSDVVDAPSFNDIAPALAQALSGALWVAYNVYFDLSFTQHAFSKYRGFEPQSPYFCAANARSLLKLGKKAKLSQSCEDFGIEFKDGQHIAIYDTWMTARLMQVWLERMAYLGLEHYGDLETLGTHKYLDSFKLPLWQSPKHLQALADEAFTLQKSRYAIDKNQPNQDPRLLPPLSKEPPFFFEQTLGQQAKSSEDKTQKKLGKSKPTTPQSAVISQSATLKTLQSNSSESIIKQYDSGKVLLKKKQDLFNQSQGKMNEGDHDLNGSNSKKVSKAHAKKAIQASFQQKAQEASSSSNSGKKIVLRSYQKEAIDAILNARRSGVKRMVVCLPTGAGKTVIFSELASMANRRVLVLAHREELLGQAQDKLQRAIGDQDLVEIEQAQNYASNQAKVVVASLRSLHAERLNRLISDAQFGLIIYDECHHAIAEDNQRILGDLGVFNSDFDGTLVGFTATTRRADGIGLDEVFETLVYSRTLQDMINDQFLVPLRGYRISTAVSLDGLEGRGDFPLEDLEEKIDIQERNGLVARNIQELARDRRTICFCVTVKHAENLAQTLRSCGVPAAVIHGEMKSTERSRILKDFREGTLQVLTNVGVLTEGFDDPEVSCIAMARPTRSESLYVQCVGRGMRLFEGKKDCIILDFVDLSALNLITLPTLYGAPVDLNFEGREAGEASQAYFALLDDHPGFEWEAESLSLSELKERAQAFDPLRLKLSPEVKAISQNGWVSLGQRGLALHFSQNQKTFSELLILLNPEAGKKRYQILLDQKEVARESLIERAVEAADYEVGRMGNIAVETASMYALWRKAPPPKELINSIKAYPLPRLPTTIEEVFRAITFYTWVR